MSSIRVRMYNVGFGDSFLITYNDNGAQKRMLVDCGSIAAGVNKMSDVVGYILDDCKDDDGQSRIDVVVATHRHRDHISGFGDERWKGVQVSEVWLPWTEHPTDPEAKRIRSKQLKLAASLHTAFLANPEPPERIRVFKDAIFNATHNAEAMETLHRGFAGSPKRRFLPGPKGYLRPFRTTALPGALVHMMGPSRDEAVIRDMDPPQDQSFHLRKGNVPSDGVSSMPFASEFSMSESEYVHYFGTLALSEDQKKQISELNDDEEPLLAAALDKAVNGTSLVFVLELNSQFLLFPGDAQWGTWKNLMANPTIEGILQKTSLYKVGHHGSHNATPKRFVESILPTHAASMVSTRKMTNWPSIPVGSLLDELASGNRCMARSDVGLAPDAKFHPSGQRHIDFVVV